MVENMNKQEILTVLEELNKISGFRISLHDKDYKEIAAYPERMNLLCSGVNQDPEEHSKCVECDRSACLMAEKTGETYIYKCRFGLTEAVSPLYNFGVLTGFLMMGQVAESREDLAKAECALARIKTQDIPDGLLHIVTVAPDMVRSYVRIMTICAEYLTAKNVVTNQKTSVPEEAKKYIEEHISEKFGISDICRALDCSKSTLLTCFKRVYGVTVNSYITEQRLLRSLAMLQGDESSINRIASDCGFSDQSYFSKVFSKQYGIPPSEYRERMHGNK